MYEVIDATVYFNDPLWVGLLYRRTFTRRQLKKVYHRHMHNVRDMKVRKVGHAAFHIHPASKVRKPMSSRSIDGRPLRKCRGFIFNDEPTPISDLPY